MKKTYVRVSLLIIAREQFVRRSETLAMRRHGQNLPGGSSAQHDREHGTRNGRGQLKHRIDICKMRFGPVPSVSSRQPPLARTQLQPISRKREQNNWYRGANTCAVERERERRGSTESEVKRERRRERESEMDLYPLPPRPMSPLSAFSPSVSCKSWRHARPYPAPRRRDF